MRCGAVEGRRGAAWGSVGRREATWGGVRRRGAWRPRLPTTNAGTKQADNEVPVPLLSTEPLLQKVCDGALRDAISTTVSQYPIRFPIRLESLAGRPTAPSSICLFVCLFVCLSSGSAIRPAPPITTLTVVRSGRRAPSVLRRSQIIDAQARQDAGCSDCNCNRPAAQLPSPTHYITTHKFCPGLSSSAYMPELRT